MMQINVTKWKKRIDALEEKKYIKKANPIDIDVIHISFQKVYSP